MADDIRLVIGVEQSGLLKAITNTESLEKKVKKLSDAYNRGDATVGRYNRAIAKLAKSSKQSTDELQRYGKALRDDEKATKKATAETKAFTLARKQATEEDRRRTDTLRKAQAETKKLAAEVDRLSSKYKPLYASSKQYENSLDEINRAHQVGALNAQQHSAAVENLNSDYQKFTSGTAGWDNQFVQGSNRAGKSMNKFGMYAQQVGYQVGDFFVQVQSGQSALVAFGQQGTQLAGLLPGVLGAVVGISLAVGTMLLRSFMDASGEAQTMEEAITGATDALDAYKDSVAGSESLKDDFGSMSSSMTNIADESARFAENMLRANIGQAVAMQSIESTGIGGYFEKFLDRWTDTTGAVYSGSGSGPLGGLTGNDLSEGNNLADLGLSPELTIGNLREYQESVANALAGREYKTAVDLMAGIYNKALSGMSDEAQLDMGTTGKEFVNSIKDQMEALAKFVKAREDAAAAPGLLDNKKLKAQEAAMLSLTDKIELLNIEILKTQDSDAYDAELSRQRIRDQDLQLLAQVASGELTKKDAASQRDALKTFEGKLLAQQKLVRLEEAEEDAQKAALKLAGAALRLRQKIEKERSTSITRQLAAAVKLAAKQEEQNKRAVYNNELQKNKTSLLRLEQADGKKTLEYRELEIQIAEQISNETSRRAGVSAQITEDLAIQARLQATIGNDISDAADDATELASALREVSTAMKPLESIGDGISKSLAVALAKVRDLEAGGTGKIAGIIEGRRQDIGNKADAAYAGGKLNPADILASTNQSYGDLDKYEAALRRIQELEDKNKGSKSTKETGRQAVEKLIREAEHNREIVNLTKERVRYEDLLFKMEERNAKTKAPLSQKQLEIAAQEIHLINEATDAFQKQRDKIEALGDTIESSIEDGFMKMIDGTTSVKDAFRSMAADIIKELYRVLVVQEMVAAAKTAMDARGGFLKMAASFFMADGGAFSGGSQMKAYADGGVDSVKKLIAQAAPKIAEMAKSSVIDSRRRGGSTKAAFG